MVTYVFVPPNSKVDTYVGTQFDRALQPALVNARLEWHGLSIKGSQAPKKIPPLYINDRVLVYQLLEDDDVNVQNVSIDLVVNDGHKISSIKLPNRITYKRDTIHRLAAKALIQELQHEKLDSSEEEEEEEYVTKDNLKLLMTDCSVFFYRNNSTVEERIRTLSLTYQILSPYTAFVGVETTGPKINTTNLKAHIYLFKYRTMMKI